MATSVAADAVSWITPCHWLDSPSIWRNQSSTCSSSSVSAGLEAQLSPSCASPLLDSRRYDDSAPPTGK